MRLKTPVVSPIVEVIGAVRMTRTIPVEQVRGRPADELLQEVTRKQETLRIEITEGEFVEIKPLPKLNPLTCLEGSMPAGWKDAIYDSGR
jgi:hypothetical protein